jgi:hypothetical protein
MRKLLNQKIAEQGGKCAICHEDFSDCSEVVPDHIEPKGTVRSRRRMFQLGNTLGVSSEKYLAACYIAAVSG